MIRLTTAALALASCFPMSAQGVSPALFNGLTWRSIGPFRGGRAVAVSGVPNGGSTFFFGSVDGGVWKTTDAGTLWSPVFDRQPIASIGALEVAPSQPNVLYVGTGESDIRSDLASGDGVYKSIDGGKSWRNVGLKDTRQISRLAIDPKDPDVVFVAALGHAYAPNEERGVFRSIDGGESWQKVLYRGPSVGAADISLAPDLPHVVFATLWEAHRPPWSTYAPLAGPGSGLFRSTDGGEKWEQITGHGLPSGDWGRAGVAVAPGTRGKIVYAAIDAKEAGLYRSEDGGGHWVRVNSDPRITSRGWYFNCITVDPNDPSVVYVPNVALYKLSDSGKTLSIVRGAPGGDDYHQLWIDPANSLHMVLGVDQGVSVTLNGGLTWSTWYNQPTGQLYHVVTDSEFPYHVYGAQQDSGTAAVASQTDHGGIDLRDWFTVGGSESGYIAPDPGDPNIFYVSGTYGSVGRFDRRTMQTQNIAPAPLNGFSAEISKRQYRDPWTPVLLFSPAQPKALYLGTQYVMRTLDGGLHWQTISPDLTGAEPQISSSATGPLSVDNAMQRGYGVVYTIAPSPRNAAEIWVGTDTGLVHVTRDNGKTWRNITPPGLSRWSKITQLEVSRFTPGEAYAAVDRHRLDDMAPYMFRTRDYGRTWTAINRGIGGHAFLNSVREDPKRKGLLFAATELGIYVSFDDGDQWEPLQLNLPVTSVRDLTIHGDDLVAATHGRGFWILDDIAPLREITSERSGDSARLFTPAAAMRMTSDHFAGTPLPVDEPQAQNPLRGAYIDYYLPQRASAEVTLEILDIKGRAIRRFSSRESVPPPPKDPPIAARWLKEQQQLAEDAGMHRFVWDLRYGRRGESTTADLEDTGIETWIGPLVLPGEYRARLTGSGIDLTRSFQVVMDLRSHIQPAELALQFQAAQRAFEDLVSARKAVAEIKKLQTKLSDTKTRLPQDRFTLLDSITSADRRCNELLSTGAGDEEKGFDALVRNLTGALGAIEGADRVPPSQVIALYETSDRALKSKLADWHSFQQNSITPLNRQLQEAGLTPL